MNMPALAAESPIAYEDSESSTLYHSSHSPASSSPPMDRKSHSQSSNQSYGSGRPRPTLARNFTDISVGNMKFLIMDCPTESTLPEYIKELLARGVTDIVRVCQPTYNEKVLEQDGIQVHDWAFPDGGVAPNNVILSFLKLCDERFKGLHIKEESPSTPTAPGKIAVHCVAGLGRAPFLVVVTLIEAGMAPLDAVEYVRKRRRGALNSIQLQYLVDSYKRQYGAGKKQMSSPFSFLRRHGSPASTNSSISTASDASVSSTKQQSTTNTGSVRASLARVFRLKRPFAGAATAESSSSIVTCVAEENEPQVLPLAG